MARDVYRIPDDSPTAYSSDGFILNCKNGKNAKPQNEPDFSVIDTVTNALTDAFLRIYYAYPDSRNPGRETIDAVVLNGNIGVGVLNIYDIEIDDIEEIEGHRWTTADATLRPTQITGNAKTGIEDSLRDRDELMTTGIEQELKIPVLPYIVLPNISKSTFTEKFKNTPTDRILFREAAEDPRILKTRLTNGKTLSDEELRHTLAVLNFGEHLSGEQLNVTQEELTRGEVGRAIQNRLKCLTDKQLQIAFELPDHPQRIRGIAGSGKTVVSALRAAHAHAHEDWDIAVTFRTKGLYQTHEKLIERFYTSFTAGEEPDFGDSLKVMHGWGGGSRDGMYSQIATAAGIDPLDMENATDEFEVYEPAEALNQCCKHLLKEADEIPELFDAIIIDEAQDLKPWFFRMCREALKDEQRLYWATDEAQNLASLTAKDLEELFGTKNGELNLDLDVRTGTVEGGSQGTYVMKRSFRTPRSILMAAHAFGMGYYRDGDVIRQVRNQKQWDRLGYRIVEGDFNSVGDPVQIKRDANKSPHPLTRVEDYDSRDDSLYPLIKQEWFESRRDEVAQVAAQIDEDLEAGFDPDDIMIIYLWPPNSRQQPLRKLYDELNDRIDESNIDGSTENILHKVHDEDPAEFWQDGKISLTQVHYARGNEAPLVYILGFDFVDEPRYDEYMADYNTWHDLYVGVRNEAFVSMSRALGWCTITGVGKDRAVRHELDDIFQDVRSSDPVMQFDVPPRSEGHDELGAE